ncbi:MAG: 5-formyltetrahydrofolate cyclo-ligase [Acidobacteriota bacterium]
MSAETTAAAKAALRRLMRKRRAAIAPDLREAASLAVRDGLAELLPRLPLAPHAVVAGYWPIKDELDPRPAMRMLGERGFDLALPVAAAAAAPLIFRAWASEMPLAPDGKGIPAPPGTATVVTPALLLVPLLAFDARGRRLGYGAGYYDRTLASLRQAQPAVAIGLAFAAQEAESVPAEPGDSALDGIVTERDVLWFGGD